MRSRKIILLWGQCGCCISNPGIAWETYALTCLQYIFQKGESLLFYHTYLFQLSFLWWSWPISSATNSVVFKCGWKVSQIQLHFSWMHFYHVWRHGNLGNMPSLIKTFLNVSVSKTNHPDLVLNTGLRLLSSYSCGEVKEAAVLLSTIKKALKLCSYCTLL